MFNWNKGALADWSEMLKVHCSQYIKLVYFFQQLMLIKQKFWRFWDTFRAEFPCNLRLLQLLESRSFTEASLLTEEHFEGPIKCTHDLNCGLWILGPYCSLCRIFFFLSTVPSLLVMLRALENQKCLGFLSVSGDLGYVMETFENGYGDTKLIAMRIYRI